MKPKMYPVGMTYGVTNVDPSQKVPGFDFSDTSSLDDKQRQIASYLASKVPLTNGNYVVRREILREVIHWYLFQPTKWLYLWGPTQSGKTSFVDEFFGRIGMPVITTTGHKKMPLEEIFGYWAPSANGLVWENGPVCEAAHYGVIAVINEFDRVRAESAIALNDAMKPGGLSIPNKGGAHMKTRPGFRLVLTGNSNLLGDVSGNYGTASTHDVSMLERIFAVHVDYPDMETDIALALKALSGFDDKQLSYWFDQEGICVKNQAGHVVKGAEVSREEFVLNAVNMAKEIRAKASDSGNFQADSIERTMSLGMLGNWLRTAALMSGSNNLGLSSLHYSMQKLLSDLSTNTTKTYLHEQVRLFFGVEEKLGDQ